MKIYIAHSSGFDYKNELYAPLRESELNENHEIFLPHETDEFINTHEIIQNANLVVAEVSYPSTGEGIELGWAQDANVKIICIYKRGHKVSSSLREVSDTFVEYEDSKDMIRKLTSTLGTVQL